MVNSCASIPFKFKSSKWMGNGRCPEGLDYVCTVLRGNNVYTDHDGAGSEAAELQISWPARSLPEPGVGNCPQEA